MSEGLFKSKGDVGELNIKVQAALGLLDSETADGIIGEQDDDYRVLIEGTQAAMTMLWMLMKSFGVKESKKALRGFSQAMLVVLTLVHYAYALGMRRGREEGEDG